MIENLLVDILSFLVRPLFHGNLGSNALLLVHPLKQSIRLWLMVLLRFFGSTIFYQFFAFLLVLLLLSGMMIWVLFICLLTRFFMLKENMLNLIITLFVLKWLKGKFKFASSPLKINQQMSLQSHSLTLFFLFYVPSFMWITNLKLEGMYYGMCCRIKNIVLLMY